MRIAKPVELTEQDRVELTRWARGRSTPARQVQRAKIVLAAASDRSQSLDDQPNLAIAQPQAP